MRVSDRQENQPMAQKIRRAPSGPMVAAVGRVLDRDFDTNRRGTEAEAERMAAAAWRVAQAAGIYDRMVAHRCAKYKRASMRLVRRLAPGVAAVDSVCAEGALTCQAALASTNRSRGDQRDRRSSQMFGV
jgi:hypothetical protein